MSAKPLCIKNNNFTSILHEPARVGCSYLVTGADRTDTNLLVQEFFRAVVSSEPNEEEEETIGVLYLTRSAHTARTLEHFAGRQRSRVGLEYYVRTYSRFNAGEILEMMADIEDRLEIRYVIIEDIDMWSHHDVVEQATRLRDASKHGFMLVMSSSVNEHAIDMKEVEKDSETFLEWLRASYADAVPMLNTAVDVQLFVDPDDTQSVEALTHTNVLIGKYRSEQPFPRSFFRVYHQVGVYQ